MDNLVLVNHYKVGYGGKSLTVSADPTWLLEAGLQNGDPVVWCRTTDPTKLYLRKETTVVSNHLVPTIGRTITQNGSGNSRVVLDLIWAQLMSVEKGDMVAVYRIVGDDTYLVYRKVRQEE